MVLLYAAPDASQPHGYRLWVATRLWLAGPEAANLEQLLGELTRVAQDNIARAIRRGQRWDPCGPEDSMVNGGDMNMSPLATFVGVGVSTLNSSQGTWQTVAQAIRNQPVTGGRSLSIFDAKGQCIALLADGTALYVERDINRPLGSDGIKCTKTLDPDRPSYLHNPHANLVQTGDGTILPAWGHLGNLHRVLADYLVPGRPHQLLPGRPG
ncbi:hypothetical protein AB0D32_03740 [Micromonospora sp. NPDC048170]|uniref:hypothetical protein n=1 Tax=Micromonospora sp. NPDC048170 TaxID=3154819 RepID=UPI0033C0CE88